MLHKNSVPISPEVRKLFEEWVERIQFKGHLCFEKSSFQWEKDFDWCYWLQRAKKRMEKGKSVRACLYNEKKDLWDEVPLLAHPEKVSRGSEVIDLPLSKKGHQKAIFFDRDGVINEDAGYVYQTDKVNFLEGIVELLNWTHDKGFLNIVLTNQSGVGRGYYTEEDVQSLHEWMNLQLKSRGGEVDEWYYSPYHPEAIHEKYKRRSLSRKPCAGMALMAAREKNLDLSQCYMVGDKKSDVLSGLDIPTVLVQGHYDISGHLEIVERLSDVKDWLAAQIDQ